MKTSKKASFGPHRIARFDGVKRVLNLAEFLDPHIYLKTTLALNTLQIVWKGRIYLLRKVGCLRNFGMLYESGIDIDSFV